MKLLWTLVMRLQQRLDMQDTFDDEELASVEDLLDSDEELF